MVLIGKLFAFISLNFSLAFAGYLAVDKNVIEPEDYIQLSLVLEGEDELVEIKNIKSFIIESQSSSSSYRYINGKASSEKTINYEITLKDPSLKKVEIGPAVIRNDGKNYETNKIIIKTQSNQRTGSARTEKDYYLVSSIERNELILNETIELKVMFFNRVRLVEASIEEPESESFFLEQKGKEKSFRKIINGKEYNVTELTYKFTPTKPGEIIIPAFILKGLAVVQDRNRPRGFGGFFEDSFFSGGFGKRKRVKASSSILKINVSKFPEEGRPEGFSGIVGEFTLSQEISKIAQNNSYKFLVNIEGKGDLSTLNTLKMPSSESFSIYAEKAEGEKGKKSFSMIIIPKKNGVFRLPKSEFSYFSVEDKKYKSLSYGGQELVFRGVEAKFESKVNPTSSEEISDTRNSSKVNIGHPQVKGDDIIIFAGESIREKVYWILYKHYSYIFLFFVMSGVFFIYYSLVKKFFLRISKSSKPSFDKQLNLIIKKEDVSARELLSWVREVLDSGQLKGINDLDQLKNSSAVDRKVKHAIRLLESSAYGGGSLDGEEFKSLKNDLVKIIQ